MGLFDDTFSPNMGWLGQVLQSRDPNDYSKLADAFGPGTPFQVPQGSYSDANSPSMMGRLGLLMSDPFGKQVRIPPISQQWTDANQRNAARDQQSNPSMNPADYPGMDAFGGPSGSPPPLAPPITIPPAPNVGGLTPGQVNMAAVLENPPPQLGGQTLDQRAYGGPAMGGAPQMPQQPQNAMAQAQPHQGGDFLGGLSNFSHNLGSSGGLGGVIDAFRGIQTGERYGTQSLQKTGTDPFTGQDTFAWVNPQNQTMKPATMGGEAAQSTPAQSLGGFSDAVKSGVTGQALYDYLPPTMKGTVKAMIEGRMSPPAGAAMRSPQTMALVSAANAIDPQFDATNWGVRSSLAKNYLAGGKQFQEIQAIGTVAGHLENLAKAAEALGNTDYPMVNGVMNWVRSNTGDPRVAKFGTDIQAVSNELSKAYRGGHVTEGDVKEWNSKINAANSPAQLKAVIGEMNDLLRSKREMLETGYKQGMGGVPLPSEFSAESEKSRKTFDSVAKWAGGEAQAAAPTATGPNGQKVILRNGQWVPMK